MNNEHSHTVGASVLTSFATALVAIGPEALTDLKKAASVLILAMVAEVGRRAASLLWSKFK
jgi:hypothetical protein